MLKPCPHHPAGAGPSHLHHDLGVPRVQKRDSSAGELPLFTTAWAEGFNLSSQCCPAIQELLLLQRGSCRRRKDAAALQIATPIGTVPAEKMQIQGFFQQAMTLQGVQLQIIQITHRLDPLSWMKPAVPQPGRLRLNHPAQQLLHRQRSRLGRIGGLGGIPDQRQGQSLRSGRAWLIQAEACRELTAITAEWRLDLKIGAIKGTGRRRQQQSFRLLRGELAPQRSQPLVNGCRRWQLLTCALAASAPADQEMLSGRHQSLKQHVAILISSAGIAELALLFQQMKARSVALTREIPPIQTHQHDHLVGNGPHRLQGTDREGAAAMTEATAVDRESLRQHFKHHRCLQVELAGLGTSAPLLQSRQPALSFPLPGATVPEEVLEQTLQLLHPPRTGLRTAQLSDPPPQPIQQGPPACQPIRIQILMKRCNTSGRQTSLIGKHQTEQPAIQTPAKAVGWIASPLIGIEAPTESTALQGGCEQSALLSRQPLLPLDRRVGQEPLEAAGRQTSAGQLQQIQHGHRQARTALLTAIGEAPGEVHSRRAAVIEQGCQQRCGPVDLGGHHQHIPGLEFRIRCQPLQDAITDKLHFPPGAGG